MTCSASRGSNVCRPQGLRGRGAAGGAGAAVQGAARGRRGAGGRGGRESAADCVTLTRPTPLHNRSTDPHNELFDSRMKYARPAEMNPMAKRRSEVHLLDGRGRTRPAPEQLNEHVQKPPQCAWLVVVVYYVY